jgi:hypothetical protein
MPNRVGAASPFQEIASLTPGPLTARLTANTSLHRKRRSRPLPPAVLVKGNHVRSLIIVSPLAASACGHHRQCTTYPGTAEIRDNRCGGRASLLRRCPVIGPRVGGISHKSAPRCAKRENLRGISVPVKLQEDKVSLNSVGREAPQHALASHETGERQQLASPFHRVISSLTTRVMDNGISGAPDHQRWPIAFKNVSLRWPIPTPI